MFVDTFFEFGIHKEVNYITLLRRAHYNSSVSSVYP